MSKLKNLSSKRQFKRQLTCKKQFTPLITHGKIGHRRKNNTQRKNEKMLL